MGLNFKEFFIETQIKGNQILQNWWNDLLFVHLITVWKCDACVCVCLWFIFIDCTENGFRAIWYYYFVKCLSNFAVFRKVIPMNLGRDPDILCVNYDTCTGYVFMVFFSIFYHLLFIFWTAMFGSAWNSIFITLLAFDFVCITVFATTFCWFVLAHALVSSV